MSYEAVVFDHDGVLVTPTDRATLRAATEAAFLTCGVGDPDPDHVESMITDVTVPGLEAVCDAYGLDPEAFWRARDREASATQREAVRAGEKTLYDDVDAIADLGVPLGVVSSNQHATVEFVLEHGGLSDRFSTCYGRQPVVESIRRKKPEPYYIERALGDLDADDALYVGDRAHDIEAAHNAGIDGALLRRPHVGDGAVEPTPDHELDGLVNLVPLLNGASG